MTNPSSWARISVSIICVIWIVGQPSGSSRIWLPQGLLDFQQVPRSNPFKEHIRWRQAYSDDDDYNNNNDNYKFGPFDGYSVGLRRKQQSMKHQSYPVSLRGLQYVNGSVGFATEAVPSKRQSNKLDNLASSQFAYLISPFSEQIIPIGRDNFLKSDGGGYMNLIALTDGYKLGLQRYITDSAADQSQYRPDKGPPELNDCRTIRSEIQLTKDELDPVSGRVLRSCHGLVQLNRCEGSCYSGIQPTIKSRTGFKKVCSCCNEGAFRRVQVRLNQCKLPATTAAAVDTADVGVDTKNNDEIVVGLNSLSDQQLKLLSGLVRPKSTLGDYQDQRQSDLDQERKLEQTIRPAEAAATLTMRQRQSSGATTRPLPLDYMDIEVDEPIECKCRRCDSAL